jgi:transposase
MQLDPASLPDDVAALRRLVADQAAALASTRAELDAAKSGLLAKTLELEKLKVQLARLRRMQFGRSSEKLDREIEQLELRLEELEAEETQVVPVAAAAEAAPAGAEKAKPARRPLPEHLPRREVVHAAACACPACGGELRRLGEDVTEVLEYEPARFHVVRHVRPKFSCRRCEAITQAPAPDLPIERGRPGPALLAHVLVSKYADHLPLYRQAEMYGRDGVELERSTLADWVGRSTTLLMPLVDELRRTVLASPRLHADDTPVPVLSPGLGRTRTGRLWVYVRDDRPHGGQAPPAAVYFYSPDRKGEQPQAHLQGFTGHLHADAYAGFEALYAPGRKPGPITQVSCWAHARRQFHDEFAAHRTPLAREALERIGRLYEVEAAVRGQPPDQRQRARQDQARPQAEALKDWIEATLPRLSGKSDLAKAMRYTLSRWPALARYLDDGTLEIDNNAAERALRGIALGRKNWLFAGSDSGGERAAALYSLIETAKLNGIDPRAWLADVIGRINTHPAKRIVELMPGNWTPAA